MVKEIVTPSYRREHSPDGFARHPNIVTRPEGTSHKSSADRGTQPPPPTAELLLLSSLCQCAPELPSEFCPGWLSCLGARGAKSQRHSGHQSVAGDLLA